MFITMILIKVFEVDLFIEDDHYSMFCCLLIFNGITVIWMTYFISFFFKTPFSA